MSGQKGVKSSLHIGALGESLAFGCCALPMPIRPPVRDASPYDQRSGILRRGPQCALDSASGAVRLAESAFNRGSDSDSRDGTPSPQKEYQSVAVSSILLGQVWQFQATGDNWLVTKVYSEVFASYAVLGKVVAETMMSAA